MCFCLQFFVEVWYTEKEESDGAYDMYDFIHDLDDYFCETYENYDKLVLLPGYKMPVMQATKVLENGRTYAYTLPSSTLKIANQEKKAEILAAAKERMVDLTFSFSFRTHSLFSRLRTKFAKYSFYKMFAKMRERYHVSDEDMLSQMEILPEIWKGICSGKYLPTKNFIFTFALVAQISMEDTKILLQLAGCTFDFRHVKDVVISYLLGTKVYNPAMVERALEEYKVSNLFFKKTETEA